MTSRNSALAKISQPLPPSPQEKLIQEQRMEDVQLLLDNLFEREEATVKLILDCLYDVGSVNLINKKFPTRPVNALMKSIARLSKPAFKVAAFYWLRKNCPQLIANWLHSKVRF